MRKYGTILAMALGLLVSACAADIAHTPPGAAAPEPYVYKLGPDDQLRITVYNEPGLTGEYTVNGEGNVSFPLAGPVPAAGKSIGEFAAALTAMLEARFYQNPHVAVDLIASRPVYVLGEVNKAGQFPYRSGMTVLGAIATAGGFTYRANQKMVMIRHPGEAAERREPLTADLLVQPGDTVRVRERNF